MFVSAGTICNFVVFLANPAVLFHRHTMSTNSPLSERPTQDSAEDAFEKAWQQHFNLGEPAPDLMNFLPPKERGDYQKVLCHLIQIDMERRWCASQYQSEARLARETSGIHAADAGTINFVPPRPLNEYLAKHSLPANAPVVLDLVVAEFESRRRSGQQVDASEYYRDFPSWQKELQEQFAEIDAAVRQLQFDAAKGGANPAGLLAERPSVQIGPYKLLQQIGEGGMGAVWMAEQSKPVQRRVALKIIKPGMDSREVIARFEAERQALALMDHPNIAKVFDAGTTESGRPFFAMELVKGKSIIKYCDEHHLTPRQRLELFLPVCQAIQHAHQKGIIHRDIKPTNVLVAPYDGKPVVKVIDFGVAKATGQRLTEMTLFTDFGAVVGTLEYMSPEQAELNNQDIDTRSDIYCLGVLLYELLTGTTPFLRSRLKQAAFTEMLRIIREEEPPKPSTRLSDSKGALPSISAQRATEPARLTKLVRGELDWIVMKALEKDRARRYETANGLAMDVQRYLADEPVEACPPSFSYQLRKFARKNRGLIQSAAAFAALLMVGIVISTWLAYRASQAEKVASSERDTAKTAEGKATKSRNDAIMAGNEANDAREKELRQLYAADLLLASRAVIEGPLARAIDLLDSWLPVRRGGVDYRGREWHMLRRLCVTSEETLLGHDGPLRALAWTKDGKRLASGGEDRIIRVWDAETGRCLQTLIGHSGGVFDVAFSPDGKLLASASDDATVRLWEVDSGQERHVLRGHILPVYAVTFHPDGTKVATAGGDTVIKFWDTTSGAELFTLQGHDAPIGRLQFDAEGKKLASCGVIRGTIVWDLETRAISDRLKPSGDVVFTPDLATGMFAFPTGEFGFVEMKTHAIDQGDLGLEEVHAFDINNEARIAAVAASDDAIHVIDRGTSSTLVTHRGHIGPTRRVLLRADARKLASAGDDGSVRIWNVPNPNVPVPYSGHHEHVASAIAFSKDGELLVSGDYLGSIAVWDSKTGKRIQILGSHFLRRKSQKEPLEIGTGRPFDKGKDKLKSQTGYTFSATAIDPIAESYTVKGHGGVVTGVGLTPDKSAAVSVGGQDLIVWNLKTGEALKEHEHPTLVSSLAVSPDGTLAATGCWDDFVRIFQIPSGELVKELEGHAEDVMCVAFHPSGKELVSGSRDQTAIVWDVATGKVKYRLRKHVNTVSVARYTPDGQRLVTGGMDKAIHVWNAATGQFESTLHGHREGVTSLELSADGKWLVSASDDSNDAAARVWIWNLGRFREGALVKSFNSKGPSSLAIHPKTGDIIMGRSQLMTYESSPLVESPPFRAEAISPESLKAKTISESRLKVLGFAVVEQIFTWPESGQGPLKPGAPEAKFLVVATSLPFSRLRVNDVDYRRFLELKKQDSDNSEPLKFSSLHIYPQRFSLADENGKLVPAQFVGRMSRSESYGFMFMEKGKSMLENLTATPQLDDRQHVCLGWEVGKDFSTKGLQLRFENDEPVAVPALELTTFRPGKPFHPASRSFEAGEGGDRLRSNTTRSPGL